MSGPGVAPGDNVTLHYRLASLGRTLVDTFDDAPETFRIGSGELDARLEKHLLGLAPGSRRSFQLTPWEAFGERDEDLLQTLPRGDFPEDAPLGHQVAFELPNGSRLLGTIVAVDASQVRVDFNHPLAGLPVEFEIEIITIDHDQ